MADAVQSAIEIADARVDPGVRAPGLWLGAAVDHRVEIAITDHREALGAHRAGEPRRDVEGVERDDAALFRLDPIDRGVVGAFGHREDAARIGLQQHLGRDVDDGGIAAGHGFGSFRSLFQFVADWGAGH